MTNREARALLSSCDHSSTTRDLLTEPRWGEWEGAPENAPLDARDVRVPPGARSVRVPIHTARPGKVACRMAVGVGLLLAGWVLKEAMLLLWEGAGWLWGWGR